MQLYFSLKEAKEALDEVEGATASASEHDSDGKDKYSSRSRQDSDCATTILWGPQYRHHCISFV